MKRLTKILETLPKWALTAICLIAILWLTLASKPLGDKDIELFRHADKVAHAIMFGGFTYCILLDYARKHAWRRASALLALKAAGAAILLGIATELLQQHLHNGRSGDYWDLLADSVGALLVALAAMYLPTRIHSKTR